MNDLDKPFNPDWVSKPGDTIKDWLEAKNISLDEFAKLIYGDSSKNHINKCKYLINALLPITDEIATKLSEVLGSTKQFWLNRERIFREGLNEGKILID